MFSVSNPTLADVAREVGVSRTTVSNAYNRPDQLSPMLRARILAAAERLGYPGPDPLARGLRRGRTGMLGLVADQPLAYLFTDPAIREFLVGMTMVLDEAEASLVLLPRLLVDDAGSSVLANAAVDGFVSICDAHNAARVAALRSVTSRSWWSTAWRARPRAGWAPTTAAPAGGGRAPAVAGPPPHRRGGAAARARATGADRSIPTTPARCAIPSPPPAWPASERRSRPPASPWSDIPVRAVPDDLTPRLAGQDVGDALSRRARAADRRSCA